MPIGAEGHGTRMSREFNREKSRGKDSHRAGKKRNGEVKDRAKGMARPADQVILSQGQSIVLTIRSIGINGEGIGYYKKKVVFVEGALPEEVVIAEITKVQKNLAYAKLVRIKERSPQRTKPNCPVYYECGGCQLQHLDYSGQLKAKKEIVVEAFQRYFRSEKQPEVRETIGMDYSWGYRNKVQLQVGKTGKKLIAGLYSEGSHQLIDISDCPVQHPMTNQVVKATKVVLDKLGIPIYDEYKQTGIIRTIVVRVGVYTEKAQLTLVTTAEPIPKVNELITELRASMPFLKSIMQNINPQKTPLIFGERTKLLWGEERINERLGHLQFSLSARAFFQLNPKQTVTLYDLVKQACGLTGKEHIVDAYCGVGTIGLWLAPQARSVRGIEIIPEAVTDATENAKQSDIKNAKFYVGKAEELLPQWAREGYRPDIVVVDPPRTGCDEQLLKTLLSSKPKKIIYVSCNPSTLAKDCDILRRQYRIEWIQPVDMFSQTSHVEVIVKLEKAK